MTFSPPVARRMLPVLALACVAVLATGCGPDDPAASAPVTTSATGTAPATSAKAGTSAKSAPAGTTAPGATKASHAGTGIGACPTRYLQATVASTQGTAGSTYTVIDFKNISQTACTLYGYPGVSLAGGTPVTQIGLAATRDTASPRHLVTLAPGAKANVTLRIVDAGNFDATECQPKPATYLQIYPPDQTTPIYLASTATACAGHVQLLTVGAVQPGAGSAS
jgi:hypothetical protein